MHARKFLDAAMKVEDKHIFYSVFKFFEERNLRLRGTFAFDPTEMCEAYVQHFHSLFGQFSACNKNSYSDRDC
jgi:hypothetical protein